ncbi:MAG: hypothetical protein K5659_01485 [Lachnospiraceae bacterium]|nr:hypothetical protein [Lachnospiraceae bacterium]
MSEISKQIKKIWYDEGVERGIEQGIERGIEQGKEQGRDETVIALLEKGAITEEVAANELGLYIEGLRKLRNERSGYVGI